MIALALISMVTGAHAQYPEDALRFATPGLGVGARALGMGGAYTGVASDYSALYWNPAGLAQLVHGEFSFGLTFHNNADASTFFGASDKYTVNATNLNAFGVVYPIPARRGNAVMAFGFTRQSSFAGGVSFNGFNPNSSIIQTWARDGEKAPTDLSNNIAYQLYLANVDPSGHFVSPIKSMVSQIGTVLEGGGLNNWSAGGAVDVAKNLSLGATVTYLAGSYRYDRSYREEDSHGIYNTFPFDFSSVALNDYIEDDIAGWNGKFGLMYRVPGHFRLGLTATTPTGFYIHETYGTTASSYFKNGDVYPIEGALILPGVTDYDVITPWVFGAGASLIIGDLVLAGDVEYTDWTQLEFSHASQELLVLNADMKTIFRGTANLRGGAEYEFGGTGFRLRAGFMYKPSPFAGDPTTFDQKIATGGFGILLGESTMIDVAYARGWWETFIYNYDATSRVDEKITTNNFMLTLTHRF